MIRLIVALLLLPVVAFAAQAPDSLVVTGPNNAQVPVCNLIVTIPGSPQALLCSVLANPTGNVSGSFSTATGSTTPRTLASREAERINVRDYGALGDTQSLNTLAVTIGSGSPNVTVSAATFSSSDVGKRLIIDGAGALRALASLTSIPVTAAGSAYTATPTVNLSGLSTASGVVAVADMAAVSASVVSGGVACPVSQSITLTLIGGNGTPAQVTGTTNSSGVLTGALTIAVAGDYPPTTANTALFPLTSLSTSGATCSTMPTILPSWGVGSIRIAGVGVDVPLTGVTASLSAGTATVGTPVVTQVVTPLSGAIIAVADAQHVTLDTNATTALSAVVTTITWGHNDAPAFAKAKTQSDTIFTNTGVSPILYASAGTYLFSASVPTWFQNASGIVGDGINRTTFKLDSTMTGPLFSWSEAWLGGGAYGSTGPTVATSISYTGPIAEDFSIVGDLTNAVEQDGLILYDRNDHVQFHRIASWYLWGRLAYTGVLLNKPQSYMRESYWTDVYSGHSGHPAVPLIEISSIDPTQGGDSTNTNQFYNLQGWDLGGQGLVIRSQMPAAAKATTYLDFNGVRMEGGNSSVSATQIQIGDPTMVGRVTNVNMKGVYALASNYGSTAISVTAPTLASAPLNINVVGLVIDAGSGAGINVSAGSKLHFVMTGMNSAGTNVTVGASTTVAQPVLLEGGGAERLYTYSVDPTSVGTLLTPVYHTGDIANTTTTSGGGFAVSVHDGTASGGAQVGQGAFDGQTIRTAAVQSAAAAYSTISGGRLNQIQISGVGNAILGGSGNNGNGPFSLEAGSGANDRSVSGRHNYSNGNFATLGDSQLSFGPMRALVVGATTVRLTTSGAAASSSTVLVLPNAGAFGYSPIIVTAFDATGINACMYSVEGLLVKRGASAATTALVGTPTVTQKQCDTALLSTSLAVTADTTLGATTFNFTGVAGINLHVVSAPYTVEVQ